MVATLDGGWVRQSDYVNAMTELESRKLIGQAIVNYITDNSMHYESITLIALIKNWNTI